MNNSYPPMISKWWDENLFMICCHASKLQFHFTSHINIGFLGQRKRIVLPHQLVLVYPPTCSSWTVSLPCLPASQRAPCVQKCHGMCCFSTADSTATSLETFRCLLQKATIHVKNEALIHPYWYSSSKIATKSRFNLILHRACRPWSLVATLPHGLQSQNRTTWSA